VAGFIEFFFVTFYVVCTTSRE